ncbi:DUF1972 domain-containing protein [Ulvibacterium sp.]|uniref:DUF1972 domain-containing protein n=1 Tax=Ulvibacterium sp. TaxID=2665914 RepID=UPI003BAA9515
MKIGIVGTRGIPAKYGGFETFAQELAPRLVQKGMNVIVYCDKDSHDSAEYMGVKLDYLNSTKSKNPLKFYYEGLKCSHNECDITIVTGLGAAIFYPIMKKGKSVIITNTDGIEYKRKKWGFFKKMFLRLSEYLDVKFSDILIADSIGIRNHLIEKYNIAPKKIWLIEYGAYLNEYRDYTFLKENNITHDNYYLIVSRLVPENNIHIMIDGYMKSKFEKPLIIVGNLDQTDYVNNLLKSKNENIRFFGGVYDQRKLKALRTSCFAHLHGHSVGGTNPSLLEAMGSGNMIIAHDNVFNKEVIGSLGFYFKDSNDIVNCFKEIEQLSLFNRNKRSNELINRISTYYNWDLIADRYFVNLRCLKR